MFPGDLVAALVTPLWRNISICQGGVRGSALMRIDLSLSGQLVFLIRLCFQQGAGLGGMWGGCVQRGRLPCQERSPAHTVSEGRGAALVLALCSVPRR